MTNNIANIANQVDDAITKALEPIYNANRNNPEFSNDIDIANKIEEELGEIFAWVRLWGNFNYQVMNNGLIGGYIGNHYHATGGEHTTECDITETFLKRTKALIEANALDCTDELNTLVNVLKDIHVEYDFETDMEDTCGECHGDGVIEDEDEDGNETREDCTYCQNGTVEIPNSNYGELTFECAATLREQEQMYVAANMEDKILLAVNKKLKLI